MEIPQSYNLCSSPTFKRNTRKNPGRVQCYPYDQEDNIHPLHTHTNKQITKLLAESFQIIMFLSSIGKQLFHREMLFFDKVSLSPGRKMLASEKYDESEMHKIVPNCPSELVQPVKEINTTDTFE